MTDILERLQGKHEQWLHDNRLAPSSNDKTIYSEAADEIKFARDGIEAAWESVIDTCLMAHPNGTKLFYNNSPAELILDIINDRDSEREERGKLRKALTGKDAAMGVLFERLAAAGVDCSDLIP